MNLGLQSASGHLSESEMMMVNMKEERSPILVDSCDENYEEEGEVRNLEKEKIKKKKW